MENAQDRILNVLKTAIEMEDEGKKCYLQAIKESHSETGRKLLQELAFEEDTHQRTILKIYSEIQKKKGWPDVVLQLDRGKKLRAIFADTCKLTGVGIQPAQSEIGALNLAIDKEKKSYDFYTDRCKNATFDAELDFYGALAAEEREHELILLDYYEYLTDPVNWFTKEEHHSLDGG